MSSVRLSVCPSVCDAGGSGSQRLEISWKLIARTISPTPSLFVAQKPSTYSQGNMGKLGEYRGGVGIWKKWRAGTQKRQYLKRVKIEETLLWKAYRKSQTFYRMVPSPTPTDSPSPRLGFATPPLNCNRYYLMKGYSYRLQIWPIHSQGPSEHKPMKKIGEMEAWALGVSRAYPGTAHFLSTPYCLRNA